MLRRLITQPRTQENKERMAKVAQMRRGKFLNKEDETLNQFENEEEEDEEEEQKEVITPNPFRPNTKLTLKKSTKKTDVIEKTYNNDMDLKAKLMKKNRKINQIIDEPIKKTYQQTTEKWRMCTEAEGKLRELSRQLDIFERDPDYFIDGQWENELPIAKPEWCIKKYSRGDAGKEKDDPFPLEVLEKMLNYIIDNIIDVDNQRNVPYLTKIGFDNHNFYDIYDFVYDRFRGINKDLTILSSDTKKESIEV